MDPLSLYQALEAAKEKSEWVDFLTLKFCAKIRGRQLVYKQLLLWNFVQK
jgi:hypothetical protein